MNSKYGNIITKPSTFKPTQKRKPQNYITTPINHYEQKPVTQILTTSNNLLEGSGQSYVQPYDDEDNFKNYEYYSGDSQIQSERAFTIYVLVLIPVTSIDYPFMDEHLDILLKILNASTEKGHPMNIYKSNIMESV